jgi:fermentation-respiration switch protein FrsA (DUF1100 family)
MKDSRCRFIISLILLCSTFLLTCAVASAGTQCAGRNTLTIRGQQEVIYFYPATRPRLKRRVLFVPGDGGWRGWALTVARTMTEWGYDVYGLDTRDYLTSFTGRTTLSESEVMADFYRIAQWITGGSGERVSLVGWSEGAGLCVLAASGDKKFLDGVITFGLGNENVLGWRWQDTVLTLAGREPDEPTFQAVKYMARIAPLRLMMIQASRDEYVPLSEAQSLHAAAKEPKRLVLVRARDHRFSDNNGEFFRVLREGLQWLSS